MTKRRMIDPPGGWLFGFPKELKDGQSYEEMLVEAGYPSEYMELALKYSRHWEEDDE